MATETSTFTSATDVSATIMYDTVSLKGNVANGVSFAPGIFNRVNGNQYNGTIVPTFGSSLVNINLGRLSAEVEVPASISASATLSATVLTTNVYHDDPGVRIAVQARDLAFDVPTVWRSVIALAVPSRGLANVDNSPAKASCSKETVSGSGLCLIELQLHPLWFDVEAEDPSSVSLSVSFADSSIVDDIVELGSVIIAPRIQGKFEALSPSTRKVL
jgi:hypothetical protein